MKKIVIAAALILIAAASQAADLPPGKWWRRPEIVHRLALTEEQQTKLDGVFRNSANELIDLRAEVEKQNIALRGELDQAQLNRAAIQKAATRLTDARGKLFERELMMLADMRSVINEEQWRQLRQGMEQMGMRQDRREPGNRPDRQKQPPGQMPRRPRPRM